MGPLTIAPRASSPPPKSSEVNLEPLPAYSPDFMPVEHLWHWLREDVTYHTCYDKKADLIAQVERFQHRKNG